MVLLSPPFVYLLLFPALIMEHKSCVSAHWFSPKILCVLYSEIDKSFLQVNAATKTWHLNGKKKSHENGMDKMGKDSRWPFMPLLALRGVQGFLSLILLGCSAYVVSQISIW